MEIDTQQFKDRLEKELILLEEELATVGKRNPSNPADWVPTKGDESIDQADLNEAADSKEQFGENEAILTDLENRYNTVKAALARIEAGTFGTCSVDGKPIERDRLEANPAAPTCKEHME